MDVFSGTLSFINGVGVYGEPNIEHVPVEHMTLEQILDTFHTNLSAGKLLCGMGGQLEQKISVN